MPHWKSMMDRDFIFAFDLNGKEHDVQIRAVEAGSLTSSGGRKAKKPLVYFEGKEKPLALNSTNAKTIAALYTNYTEKWVGKWITIYPTTTQMGGETVECIRVKPTAPRGSSRRSSAPEPSREERRESDGANLRRALIDKLRETHPELDDKSISRMSNEDIQAEIELVGKEPDGNG